jgi:hypothetical protein
MQAKELKNTLRDRLLIGVRSPAIKTRLFSLATTTDLTWNKACSEAQTMKLAHNETKSCQSTPVVTQSLNRITIGGVTHRSQRKIKGMTHRSQDKRLLTNSIKHVIGVMVSIIQTVVMPRHGYVINVPKLDILLKHVNHHDRYSSNTHQAGDSVNTVQGLSYDTVPLCTMYSTEAQGK